MGGGKRATSPGERYREEKKIWEEHLRFYKKQVGKVFFKRMFGLVVACSSSLLTGEGRVLLGPPRSSRQKYSFKRPGKNFPEDSRPWSTSLIKQSHHS